MISEQYLIARSRSSGTVNRTVRLLPYRCTAAYLDCVAYWLSGNGTPSPTKPAIQCPLIPNVKDGPGEHAVSHGVGCGEDAVIVRRQRLGVTGRYPVERVAQIEPAIEGVVRRHVRRVQWNARQLRAGNERGVGLNQLSVRAEQRGRRQRPVVIEVEAPRRAHAPAEVETRCAHRADVEVTGRAEQRRSDGRAALCRPRPARTARAAKAG